MATTSISATTAAKTAGSVGRHVEEHAAGETRDGERNRNADDEPGNRQAQPVAEHHAVDRGGAAPSAMRTPISGTRCATV